MSRKGLFVPVHKYLRSYEKSGLIKWNMFQVKEGFNLRGTCAQGHAGGRQKFLRFSLPNRRKPMRINI